MSKDPAFLFYSQDFYTGVATLNWEERGKFISILCLMHQKGRLSEETIRFLVGSISDNLKCKFSIDEKGLWYNKRLEEETVKRNKFTESRRINGLSGGRPKNKKPKTKPTTNLKDTHTVGRMEDENEDVIDNENNNKKEHDFSKPDIDGDEIVFPIDTPAVRDLWVGWKRYRWAAHSARYGMMGEQADLKRLERMDFKQIESTVLTAIASNWKNLYPEKNGTRSHNNGKGNSAKENQSRATSDYLTEYYSNKAKQQ